MPKCQLTRADEAKAFYVDKLGFREAADVRMGHGFRWVRVSHPDQPELELTLMKPGPRSTKRTSSWRTSGRNHLGCEAVPE